ncbi:thioesterase [Streptomyces minutiscleroticus]|uniref:Thioesterase n=1 Tax=Streptomyces minutiscleroticus TaxID=68238 RepID=A0A918U8Q3_9ACTN|nr:hotdog domain-containing protein [Streptomyces minutiscleroticus]GGY10434.1 thioesterase [Streptomyces minutiscleroticus]
MSEMLTEPRPVFDSLIGRSATRRHVVGPRDLATAWDNDVEVLATPVLLWLSEVTAMDVLGDHLTEGWMTVGLNHDSAHLAPTPAGEEITVTAMLTEVDGKLLTFSVEARDSRAVILRGVHGRAVINREKFLSKLAERSA